MDRRRFLRDMLMATAAAQFLDIDQLLWTPKPIITVPALPATGGIITHVDGVPLEQFLLGVAMVLLPVRAPYPGSLLIGRSVPAIWSLPTIRPNRHGMFAPWNGKLTPLSVAKNDDRPVPAWVGAGNGPKRRINELRGIQWDFD